jgi:hypothetical protein
MVKDALPDSDTDQEVPFPPGAPKAHEGRRWATWVKRQLVDNDLVDIANARVPSSASSSRYGRRQRLRPHRLLTGVQAMVTSSSTATSATRLTGANSRMPRSRRSATSGGTPTTTSTSNKYKYKYFVTSCTYAHPSMSANCPAACSLVAHPARYERRLWTRSAPIHTFCPTLADNMTSQNIL